MSCKHALKGVGPGQTTGVIKLPSGYAIVKVLEQAPAARPAKTRSHPDPGVIRRGRCAFDLRLLRVCRRANGGRQAGKPDGWNRDIAQACEIRTQAVSGVLDQLEPLLKRPGAPPTFLRDVNSLLADLHSYRGDMDDAIRYWQAAYQLVLENSPDRVPQLEESLGVAYLQKAGSTLFQHFVFPKPLRPRDPESATKAGLAKGRRILSELSAASAHGWRSDDGYWI